MKLSDNAKIKKSKFSLHIHFKYSEHTNTEEYLDMLYLNNYIPLITKPTRITDHSSTLIDHIYSNTTIQNTVSGIALIDISDHLPVFCISGISANRVKKTIYLRDYSHFDETKYVDDMNSINWTGMFSNHENLQEMTTECINTITQIINKHAPKRKASLSKLKQLAKPWLSKGLIKSIKTKQKLYRSHFLSKDPTKISRYKTYSNVLNKLKTKTKKEYYTQQFQLCKDNLKSTWKGQSS